VIILNDIYYQYEPERVEALGGVSLEIKDGEHLALIGPNGCGKTTLLQHLNALLLPARGTVTVDGLDTQNATNHPVIRSLVGMVFQNPENQIIGMTVEEDVAFGPENLCLPPAEIRERVAGALERVGIAGLAQRNIENLSGGEKRLVAIAGVLAMQPRYIALDEPTAFLDPAAARRILRIIDKLSTENIGIIHITHNMTEAAGASRIVVLNAGRISLLGTPAEIFSKVKLLQDGGMQLPEVTTMMVKLQEMGFSVRTDIVRMEDAVEQIKLLIKSGQ
jgi:biotin transport system ATP-binding protein/energy-coupling factor transport system ATP-binding protein